MNKKTPYTGIVLLVILVFVTSYFYFQEIRPQTSTPRTEKKEDKIEENGNQVVKTEDQENEIETPEEEAEEVYEISEAGVKNLASNIVSALKKEDFEELAKYVHPEQGLRFSPYSYVDVQNDVVLHAEEIKTILASSRKFMWGRHDGSGKPIEMSFSDYYDRFIYDAQFEDAEQIAYNDVITTGNMIQNVEDVYENAHHVEYYVPGTNPDYGGMDWRSLRLVFEELDGKLYLVGIIHNEWTI